jgi:hypothetical protein
VTWPEIGKHHEFITGQLEAGVRVKTIHQRLAGEHQLAASYASLRRYVAANVPEEVRREQVRVLRLAPREPGEEAQIDYGQLGRWADPVTGARHVICWLSWLVRAADLRRVVPTSRCRAAPVLGR